jgi:hypothetical protein
MAKKITKQEKQYRKKSAECRKEEAQQNDEHLRDCDCCSVDFLDDHNDDSILASEIINPN